MSATPPPGDGGPRPAKKRRHAAFEWVTSWPEQTYTVTHDLSNKMMAGIGGLQVLLSERDVIESGSEPTVYEYATTLRDSWPKYRDLGLRLVETYETDMSPMRLFEVGPLADLPGDTKVWLRSLIHESWVARFEVHEHLRRLTATFHAADKDFVVLAALLNEQWPWMASNQALGTEALEAFIRKRTSIHQMFEDLRSMPILSCPTPNPS